MRNRKRYNEQEEGAPEWMNTYGDMITLLLTFFVLLFSFSSIDALKWEKIVSSFSGTPYVAIQSMESGDSQPDEIDNSVWETYKLTPTPLPTPDSTQTEDPKAKVAEKFNELYQKIKYHIEENGLGFILYVEKQDETILLRLRDSALFDSAKASIKEDAEEILIDVCNIINEYYEYIKIIRIEGHTDNRPISTAKYASNWELSVARAVEVFHYIVENTELDEAKFFVGGYGEFHPVASNDTEEGRVQNRRVDFVIESIIED